MGGLALYPNTLKPCPSEMAHTPWGSVAAMPQLAFPDRQAGEDQRAGASGFGDGSAILVSVFRSVW